MAQERLNKVMANAGIASRRACDEMIQAGRVTVNGQVVTELGVKVDPARDQIRVDGDLLKPRVAERRNYLMLYKPAGVLSVFDDPRGRPGLESLLSGPVRLYPVGRLDLDSEGLLLLTDDGDLTLKLSHPRFEHVKTYLVLVDRVPGTDSLARYRRGILLEDGMTAPSQWRVLEHPAVVPPPDDPAAEEGVWLHVTMHEGRKRQIRRMAAAEKLQVRRLVRVGLGSLRLDRKLRPGESRPLTHREMQQLLQEVEGAAPPVVPRRREKSGESPNRGQSGRAPGQAVPGPRPSGPRPSGARGGGPRREDQPEREPGRRPPYASGPKPGPRTARAQPKRRAGAAPGEDRPEREPRRAPASGQPPSGGGRSARNRPGSRPARPGGGRGTGGRPHRPPQPGPKKQRKS
jgi:23S rRNA pseudouridine2605 synthase